MEAANVILSHRVPETTTKEDDWLRSVSTIILQRLGLGLLTLVVVSLVIFCAVEMLPGDFAEAILGQGATPEAVTAIREQLGLSLIHI